MKSAKYIEPYRLFFPLGLLAALTAVVPWFAFYMGWSSSYPLMTHARLMVMGFLMSYICGFLMTAIPKMTASFVADPIELYGILGLGILQISLSFFGLDLVGNFISVLQFLAILIFVMRRFLHRRQTGPIQLAFVPIGLVSGLIGSILFLFPQFLSIEISSWANKLLFQAFVLNLILGLGSRLVPALSRKNENFNPLLAKQENRASVWLEVVFFNLTFVLEAFVSSPFGLLLRFAFVSYYLVKKFKVFKKSLEPSSLGLCLNIASVFLLLPLVALAFWPQFEMALLHLLFIGGFALITLMISVRVTLSHGGFGLYLEKNNSHLVVTAVGLVILAILRSVGPQLWVNHTSWIILFSALIWMMIVGWWIIKFVKMYKEVRVSQC